MEKAIAWLDVESNGRSPEVNELLEVALIVTDFRGEILTNPYSSLVKVADLKQVIAQADPLAKRMHEHSGLWKDLWELPAKSPKDIDLDFCEILETVNGSPTFFVGGNSISLDRGFANIYLPNFSTAISHMSVDVTSIASVLQENSVTPKFYKKPKHRALEDVYDSIEEYRYHLNYLLPDDS